MSSSPEHFFCAFGTSVTGLPLVIPPGSPGTVMVLRDPVEDPLPALPGMGFKKIPTIASTTRVFCPGGAIDFVLYRGAVGDTVEIIEFTISLEALCGGSVVRYDAENPIPSEFIHVDDDTDVVGVRKISLKIPPEIVRVYNGSYPAGLKLRVTDTSGQVKDYWSSFYLISLLVPPVSC
jgi:hypothetical protein